MSLKIQLLIMVFIILSSFSNLIIRTWRINIIVLIIQYISVFSLIATLLPPYLAAVKLLTGIMVSAVLGITLLSQKRTTKKLSLTFTSDQPFFFMIGLLVIVLVVILTPGTKNILENSASEPIIISGLTLIGLGLLQLSVSSDPLYITIGLLTFVSGFELIYAIVEVSILLTGLLAGINLGLVTVGAWFLTRATEKGS